MTISELIMEYFKKNPKKELNHGPIVDAITKQWLNTHKEPPRDPWRAIRKLHQEGVLIKVKKGIYKYDPVFVQSRDLEDFTAEQKAAIFKRDGYKCVVCGVGEESGKKMFIRLYELAKATNDQIMVNFCKEVLKTFDKHDVNGHIPWKD